MNRPLHIAAFVLLAFSVSSLPVLAQHGGGHASGGGHFGGGGHVGGGHVGGGGMSARGGFSGHSSGRSFSGMHSGSRFGARSNLRGSFRGPLSSRRFNGPGFRIRTRDFRNCFSFGCRGFFGNPYWYGGFYDPYWWWDSGSSYDQDRQNEIAMANQMNQQSLEEQRMRQQQQDDPDPDIYANVGPAAPPRPRPQPASEAVPPTVLVFRDQRRQEVQNYAIVGQTLFNFAPQHTEKIPLSDLDIPATTKANDDRGVDFHVPGAHEGQ